MEALRPCARFRSPSRAGESLDSETLALFGEVPAREEPLMTARRVEGIDKVPARDRRACHLHERELTGEVVASLVRRRSGGGPEPR